MGKGREGGKGGGKRNGSGNGRTWRVSEGGGCSGGDRMRGEGVGEWRMDVLGRENGCLAAILKYLVGEEEEVTR